jgi:tRNA pseudouridine55 synthase
MDALFNVYKPKGPTSHGVVARLRRAAAPRGAQRRIGHAGTLDPLAEGVLVVAAGQATRVLEYLAEAPKVYLAQVTLGVETTTYDAEGQVVAERPVAELDRRRIEAALAAFRGVIDQRPPMYSAVSVGGTRLYQVARRGGTVEVPLRRVEITRLELVEWTAPVATLHVECSKGTYVRSLAHDLGAALGCGAHLSGLARLQVGSFLARDAVPLAALEARFRDGSWPAVAIAPDAAVSHLAAVHLAAEAASRLAGGLAVPADWRGPAGAAEPGTLARAYGADGRFVAIVRRGEREGRPVWRPEKVFARAA